MADLASKLAEGVTCSICHEYYTTPKVLGCLHRFCRNCLQYYINTKGRVKGIVCPECRQVTRPPASRSGLPIKMSVWADHFPTDFLVKSMVDNLKSQKNKNEDCSIHVGNPMVLFCQDCNKTICHVCAGVDHRKCERVIPLRQEAEKERDRLEKHLDQIREQRKILKSNSEKLAKTWTDLDNSYDKSVHKVKREFQKIQKIVKDREDTCLKDLRSELNLENLELGVTDMMLRTTENVMIAIETSIDQALKTKPDARLIQDKVKISVPDVDHVEYNTKRAFDSYDDVFGSVLKKAKIEETKTFLEKK